MNCRLEIRGASYDCLVDIKDLTKLQEELCYIIERIGYTVYGNIKLGCKATKEEVEEELQKTLPDGQPVYTNVDPKFKSDYNYEGYEEFGNAIIVGNKRIVPELTYIIRDLLDAYEQIQKGIPEISESDLENIDEKIAEARKAFQETDALDDDERESRFTELQLNQLIKDTGIAIGSFQRALQALIKYSENNELISAVKQMLKAEEDYVSTRKKEDMDFDDIAKQRDAYNRILALGSDAVIFQISNLTDSYNAILELFSITIVKENGLLVKNPQEETLKDFLDRINEKEKQKKFIKNN